jgi:SAM-dependent methyltransferase
MLPYWEARATRWNVEPPLSPQADDVRFCESRADAQASRDGPLTALLLGVTAALATMRWPAGTRLTSMDWADGMLRRVLPRDEVRASLAVLRADWREMPIAESSIDFVLGDGCFTAFPDFEGAAAVAAEVARVLKPRGEFCIRCFRRPDAMSTASELFAELLDGRIANLELFRWMVAIALQGEGRRGVALGDVWEAWHARVADPREAQRRLGWSDTGIANFESWRGARSRYYFPSLSEIAELAGPGLEIALCEFPKYEWGEQFPRLVLRRRG